MAAIPEALVESELFGHVKGAFTHAVTDRVGRFEAADGGTLFIDEIGDFPLAMQAKLLRVLETRTLSPVGSNRAVPVNVRVVAATSRPLLKMTQAGEFREDLYYRLNVIAVALPPLRERRPDIPLLVQHFLGEFAAAAGRKPPRVAPELLQQLEALDWPGTVRQLRNCLERMSVLSRGEVLTPADLPPDLREPAEVEVSAAGARLESVKRSTILKALDQFDGNRTRAAEFLGISVRTLQRKLRDWGMAGPGPEA
jgi:DNA-binding NtrC family response regulator